MDLTNSEASEDSAPTEAADAHMTAARPARTAVLNLRIDPVIKDALRIAAAREHRSVANLIEVMVLRHCEQARIRIPGASKLPYLAIRDDAS